MTTKDNQAQVKWRSSTQIVAQRQRALRALNASQDGATAEIDTTTLRNLIEICDQAIWTERCQEHPDERATMPAPVPVKTKRGRRAVDQRI